MKHCERCGTPVPDNCNPVCIVCAPAPQPCGDCDPCIGGRPDQCALFAPTPPAPAGVAGETQVLKEPTESELYEAFEWLREIIVAKTGSCDAIYAARLMLRIDYIEHALVDARTALAAANRRAEEAEAKVAAMYPVEEFEAWLLDMDRGDFPTPFTTVRNALKHKFSGIAAFVAAQRSKGK